MQERGRSVSFKRARAGSVGRARKCPHRLKNRPGSKVPVARQQAGGGIKVDTNPSRTPQKTEGCSGRSPFAVEFVYGGSWCSRSENAFSLGHRMQCLTERNSFTPRFQGLIRQRLLRHLRFTGGNHLIDLSNFNSIGYDADFGDFSRDGGGIGIGVITKHNDLPARRRSLIADQLVSKPCYSRSRRSRSWQRGPALKSGVGSPSASVNASSGVMAFAKPQPRWIG